MEIISQFLADIPLLLQYYLPGYWAITVFEFFSSKKLREESKAIMSCVISYVLLAVTSLFTNIATSVWKRSGIAVIAGTLLAFIISTVWNSEYFSCILVKLAHKTPNDSIWHDVLDLNNGSNLKLSICGLDYYIIGHHRNIEENGNDSWIVLSEFIKIRKVDGEILESHEGHVDDLLVIRLAEVEYIEIYN